MVCKRRRYGNDERKQNRNSTGDMFVLSGDTLSGGEVNNGFLDMNSSDERSPSQSYTPAQQIPIYAVINKDKSGQGETPTYALPNKTRPALPTTPNNRDTNTSNNDIPKYAIPTKRKQMKSATDISNGQRARESEHIEDGSIGYSQIPVENVDVGATNLAYTAPKYAIPNKKKQVTSEAEMHNVEGVRESEHNEDSSIYYSQVPAENDENEVNPRENNRERNMHYAEVNLSEAAGTFNFNRNQTEAISVAYSEVKL